MKKNALGHSLQEAKLTAMPSLTKKEQLEKEEGVSEGIKET